MPDEIAQLKKKLAELEQRLSRLEKQEFISETSQSKETVEPPAKTYKKSPYSFISFITHLGRTLTILGGGFLLRSATESQFCSVNVGVSLGMAYSYFWLWMANRAALKNSRYSAIFFGITMMLTSIPLVWEGSTKFGILNPGVSATLIFVSSLAAFIVAKRRKMEVLALLVVVPSACLATLLAFQMQSLLPFLVALLLIGAVTSRTAVDEHWNAYGFTSAFVLNATVALVVMTKTIQPDAVALLSFSNTKLASFLLVYLSLYSIVFTVRSLKTQSELPGLYIAQQWTALVVSLVGLALLPKSSSQLVMVVGGVVFALSILFFISARHISQHPDKSTPTITCFAAASAFCLACGAWLSLPLFAFSILMSLSAVVLFTSSLKFKRGLLLFLSIWFILLSTLSSGLIIVSMKTYWGSTQLGIWKDTDLWVSLISLVTFQLVSFPVDSYRKPSHARISLAIFSGILFFCIGAIIVSFSTLLTNFSEERRIAFGAMVRNGVLSSFAPLLAWLSLKDRLIHMRYLIIPSFIFGGILILIIDFPSGNASVLFVALALYGMALLLTPRILKLHNESDI